MLVYDQLDDIFDLLEVMYSLHEDMEVNVEVIHNLLKAIHILHKP